jgi:hypothetical protein
LRQPSHYQPLKDLAGDRVDDPSRPEPQQVSPEQPAEEFLTPGEQLEAEKAQYQEQQADLLRSQKINRAEFDSRMAQWESKAVVRIEDEARANAEARSSSQQEHRAPSRAEDASPRSEDKAAREADAAEHEFTGGEEMTEAQQERFNRLMDGGFHEAEREVADRQGDGHQRGGRERGD